MKLILILFFSINLFSSGNMNVEPQTPGLKVGHLAPELILPQTDGKTFTLSEVKKKVVIVFYRGSWCPYCVKQLNQIQKELIPKLENTQLIAISVDRPMIAKKLKDKFKYSFQVLSDPKATSLKNFKIANKLDDTLVKKYKNSYKIDVESDSGETHHLVAHPAVFIISADKKVVFADIHINYKQRTKIAHILKALKD